MYVTLDTFSGDGPLSALFVHKESGLILVGTMNGAVRLYFPDTQIDAEKVLFKYIVLRNRANESVRTLFLKDGMVYAAIGDLGMAVWDLRRLQEKVNDTSSNYSGANCEMFGFDRVHSHGTCTNSFLFQNELVFSLVIAKGTNVYRMNFGATSESQQPFRDDFEFSIPFDCLPCDLTKKYFTQLKCQEKRIYTIQVLDWESPERESVFSVEVKGSLFNDITPYSIQTCRDYLMAVVDLKVIYIWNIKSRKLLHKCSNHKMNCSIVAARFYEYSDQRDPLVISVGTDGLMNVLDDGKVVQSISLPDKLSNFSLEGPFFIEPLLTTTDRKLTQVLFNDDTGIHMLHF